MKGQHREGMEKCSLRRKDSELRLICPFSVFCATNAKYVLNVRSLVVSTSGTVAGDVSWLPWKNKRVKNSCSKVQF